MKLLTSIQQNFVGYLFYEYFCNQIYHILNLWGQKIIGLTNF